MPIPTSVNTFSWPGSWASTVSLPPGLYSSALKFMWPRYLHNDVLILQDMEPQRDLLCKSWLALHSSKEAKKTFNHATHLLGNVKLAILQSSNNFLFRQIIDVECDVLMFDTLSCTYLMANKASLNPLPLNLSLLQAFSAAPLSYLGPGSWGSMTARKGDFMPSAATAKRAHTSGWPCRCRCQLNVYAIYCHEQSCPVVHPECNAPFCALFGYMSRSDSSKWPMGM